MIISLIHWKNEYIPAIEKNLGEKIYECRDRQEAMKVLPEAEMILTFGGGDYAIHIDEEMLAVSHKLKLVCSLSAGIEKLPLRALGAKGVKVTNTRGVHGVSIAEYVLGGMLVMSHQYHTFIRNQAQSRWAHVAPGEDLEEKTLCVIGAGSIGREIGRKAKAIGMQVVGLKRQPEPIAFFDQVWGMERLYEALELGDYVALVTPLTEETYHLMGAEEFRRMKETAVFINVSRGDTVDEKALVQALEEKQIAGAIMDVFHQEPLPADSPLWKMDNVLVTPHAAGPTRNTLRKTIQMVVDNISKYRQGQELVNQLT